MNFFTSFHEQSTFHLSWLRYSTNIFTIQDSLDIIKPIFTNTIKNKSIEFYGKKTHRISDIIKIARQSSYYFVLINSDIELSINDELWSKIVNKSREGLVIGNRYNYTENHRDAEFNPNGIDFFVINSKLTVPDNDMFHIGLCGWDWWIPYLALKQNIPIFKIKQPFIYHKIHPRNWDAKSCKEMREYFCKLTGCSNDDDFKKEILNIATDIK